MGKVKLFLQDILMRLMTRDHFSLAILTPTLVKYLCLKSILFLLFIFSQVRGASLARHENSDHRRGRDV